VVGDEPNLNRERGHIVDRCKVLGEWITKPEKGEGGKIRSMKVGCVRVCLAAALLAKARGQPVITEEPQSRTVKPGVSVQFKVGAVGATPLRYQWQFNNVNIPAATTRTLNFYATASRAGTYSALVSDANGNTQVTQPASLEVQPRPVILGQPKNVIVGEHGTAVFDVRMNNSGPYTGVQWWHHSAEEPHHPIPEAPDYYDVHSFHFAIPDCNNNGTYNGLYWIMVTNRVGWTVSRRASLTVVGPPRLTSEPQDRLVRAGGTTSFSVSILRDAAGPKTKQWYRDGQPLPGQTGRTLTLYRVQPDDQGTYYCVVSSSGGTTTSFGATLTVD
jgi:hypothetical protein